MSAQWVFTPRTLPPRVLFPESISREEDTADSILPDDSPAGPSSPAAYEVTPVRERFCIQRRMCDDTDTVIHNCEVCDKEIGVGICKGCNDFLCVGCVLKEHEGCEGLMCDECNLMVCGKCCYHSLPALRAGCIGSSGVFACPPGGCTLCPELWHDWLERHADTETPPFTPVIKQGGAFEKLFCSFTPKSEQKLSDCRPEAASMDDLADCRRDLTIAAAISGREEDHQATADTMEHSVGTSGSPNTHVCTSDLLSGESILHSGRRDSIDHTSGLAARGETALAVPLRSMSVPASSGQACAKRRYSDMNPFLGLTPIKMPNSLPDEADGCPLQTVDNNTPHTAADGKATSGKAASRSVKSKNKRVSSLVAPRDPSWEHPAVP